MVKVKIWGYEHEGRCHPPNGMDFVTHKISKNKKVRVQLPPLEDIQKMVIARQMIYFDNLEVRQGMKEYPKDFEERLKTFRQLGIDKRNSGKRGGIVYKAIRPSREQVAVEEDEGGVIKKWDFQEMGFNNTIVDWIKRELRRREYQRELVQKGRISAVDYREELELEKLERKTWLTRVLRDIKSDRVNEILANYRMVTRSGIAVGYQPYYTIFLENAVHSLKTHDWPGVCRGLLGMLEKIKFWSNPEKPFKHPHSLNAFWTLGFLAVINCYKGDVQKVEEFGKWVHTLMRGNPLWICCQLAAWMVKQGYVKKAQRIVEELGVDTSYIKDPDRYPNPKRDMAMYFVTLIKASYLFIDWRKEKGSLEGNLETLRRKGEATLALYENLFDWYKRVHSDPMNFLDALVELTIEYRSVQRAREILEEIFNLNDGHYFVEKTYVKFLKQHYVEARQEDKELVRFLERRMKRKFCWNGKKQVEERKEVMKKSKRQVQRWKEQKKKELREKGGGSTFIKVDNPGFSW